jgi:hypothetical protein
MKPIEPTPRTTVNRIPSRATYDRAAIEAILDEAIVGHVGFVADGQPYVLPMSIARLGDRLIIHGAPASRLLLALRAGAPLCVTVTLLDGLVLARSAFRHSVNYRSVVVLGSAEEITDRDLKRAAMAAFVEHVLPGRGAEVRAPSDAELDGTRVLALPVTEASAKVRSGPPADLPVDLDRPTWAGVLPLRLEAGSPVPEARVPPDLAPPDSVTRYRRRR